MAKRKIDRFCTNEELAQREAFVKEIMALTDAHFEGKSDPYVGITCCELIEKLQAHLSEFED